MGSCKDSMKPTTDRKDDSNDSSFFGKVLPRKKKDTDKGSSAEKYADNIDKADKKLQELIILKSAELDSEKGCELSNSLKLGNLKNQQMHLDAIIDLMNDYGDIK